MIKRIAVLSLLLVYLSTTGGFALSLHFCGTKISNVRINQSSQKPCCSKETETKPDKCCKDKHIKIKISDQQQTIQAAKIPAVSNVNLFIIPEGLSNLTSNPFILASRLDYRGPPVTSDIPLSIQNCIFRI
jgi:hypothetical protein